jgi:GntR family transcriptional regulator
MQKDFIDRASGIPVYRQLAEHIKAQIIKGVYKPGDVLPSEAELIRDLNISRTTVRLAFGLVSNAGLIRREQGRGTIVVSQVRTTLPTLDSFSEEVVRMGRVPGNILLGQAEENLSLNAANAFNLTVDDAALKVTRLRLADDQPIGLAISWLNSIQFPVLKTFDYSSVSLYQLFEKQLGFKIRNAIENIRADIVTDYEARKLGIKSGSPVIRMSRTTYVQDERDGGIPIEYVEVAFNGLAYSIDVELFRKL